MKKVIIIPTFYKHRHQSGRRSMVSKILFDRISRECGFECIYTDSPNLRGVDVALVYASHRFPRMVVPPSILKSMNTKIVYYYADLPCYGNRRCRINHKLMMDKCDIAIGGYSEFFAAHYPEHLHKYMFLPGRFYPYESYANLEVNPNPIMKCLLSGHVNLYYPFRRHIKSLYNRNMGDLKRMLVIKGPGRVPFENYPAYLNSYFCAIATSGMHACLVGKYFEIPAVGALLLAKREKELDRLGYEPYVHYVPITKQNVVNQIQKVLTNFDDYNEMRHVAMKFVRANYSDINTIQHFKAAMKKLET